MKGMTFTATVLGAVAMLSMSTSSVSFADGMPFKEKKPQPILTPLDEALNEIENTEPPVKIAEPPPAEEKPEPPVAVKTPEPVPPVPQSRIVEVQPNTSFFGLSVGMYDPFTHGEDAASFNLEWQPGVKIAGFLQPIFGAMATTNGALLGYGGVGVPINLTKNIFLMPSIAVGAYEEGNGYDLDRTLAFRVGTELAYQFENKSRLGLNAHVLTNGRSFDREDRTEIISLVYTTPLDILSGKNRKYDNTMRINASGDAPSPKAKLAADVNPYKTTVNN